MDLTQPEASSRVGAAAWALPAAIAASFAVVVVATMVALTVERFAWEVDVTLWVQKFDLGAVRFVRGWLFWMGQIGVAGVVLLAMTGSLWLRAYLIEAAFVGLTAVPNFFNFALRAAIQRPRPTVDLVEVIGGPQGFSFPSGHAIHVLFFYGFLLFLADRFLTNRRLFRALMILGAIYLPLSGLWLVYDGRHWLSDVLSGYTYGALYLLVWIAAYRWTKREVEEKGRFRWLIRVLLMGRRQPIR